MSVASFGSGVPLVFDTSAWHRQSEPSALGKWEAAIEAGLLVSCPVAALEILTATRDEPEFAAFEKRFAALPQAPVTASACQAALGAAHELGAQRRIPAADYLIAAAAAERGFGVLHADKHFDLLAPVLGFESVRID